MRSLPTARCPGCGAIFPNYRELAKHQRVGCHESDPDEAQDSLPAAAPAPMATPGAPMAPGEAQDGVLPPPAPMTMPGAPMAPDEAQDDGPPPVLMDLVQHEHAGGRHFDDVDAAPPHGAQQLRAKRLERDAQGEQRAYFHRMDLLRSSNCTVHPLKRFGGIVNLEQLKASMSKSQVDFDHESAKLHLNFAPKPGRGDLSILTHGQAAGELRKYAADLGLRLQSRLLEFDDGVGGKRQLPGFFAPWRALIKYAAENPLHIGKQRVYTSATGNSGSGEAEALRAENGERYYSHATDSDAYIKAVEEERTRRVHLHVDLKDVDLKDVHTLNPWAVYTFILFQDAAAEPDGQSFMMWHAVSAHIPLEEQSKPQAWLTIGIAAKLSFETPTIASLPESVTLRANCEAAYDDAVLGELFKLGAGGVAVRQRWAWDVDVEVPTTVVAGVHALVLDNPQQAAVLGVTGCPYCMQPNRRRACFRDAADSRSKATVQPALMDALDAMQHARGPRDLELRIAKKLLSHLGVRWPPKLPITYLSHLNIQPYHVSAYLILHNVGLCMLPNTAQLTMQLLFDEMGGQRAFDAWLARANAFVKQEVVKGWTCVVGRCRSKGLGGILRKATGAPTVRSKSKYDVANAFKFFALIVHEPLLSIARAAAADERCAPSEAEVHAARQRGNRAKLAILALRLLGEFANLVKKKVISERATRRIDEIAKELMPVVRTAFEGRKNFHKSNNWHKLRHVAQLIRSLGPLMGGTNDEHAEMCQKLLHVAYQHFSNKTSNAIQQIADYLSRHAAMKHAERWLALSNADLVRSAEMGIAANVKYLLDNGVVDALSIDDATGRRPGDDALAAACRRGDKAVAKLLLAAGASASGCAADGCAHLISAARSPDEGAIGTVRLLLRARADALATWSRLSAAEWAEREGNEMLADRLEEEVGVRRRSKPRPTPTPRMDPTLNRLRPPPRRHRLVNLSSLRLTGGGKTQLRACPMLGHLELALRVWCNGNVEDVPLALARTTITTTESGILSHVPLLPPESLASVDLRPGVLFKQTSSEGDDDAPMGFSAARLLQLKRKALPAYDASSVTSGRRAIAWREFVSVHHNDTTYDAYGFLGELIFTFRFKRPDGEHADLALVRWMDDAPPEELGEVFVNEDEDHTADAWQSIEARMREPTGKRSRHDGDEDDEGDVSGDGDEDGEGEEGKEEEEEEEEEGEGEGEGEGNAEESNEWAEEEQDGEEGEVQGELQEEEEEEEVVVEEEAEEEAEEEEEEAEEEEEEEAHPPRDSSFDAPQRPTPGGVAFRRYVYAIRTQTQGAARAHYAKAWYGIVRLDEIRCAVPLSPPHFSKTEEEEAWKAGLETVVYSKRGRSIKEVNLEATLSARSSFIYDHHRAGS